MTDMPRVPPREHIVQRLATDLIGPRARDEVLKSLPSDIYLTGILWPRNTEVAPEEDERLAIASGEEAADDAEDAARPTSVSMKRPSTAGISFAATGPDGACPEVEVSLRYAVYEPEETGDKPQWRRREASAVVRVQLDPAAEPDIALADAPIAGLRLNRRIAQFHGGYLATVTLVNDALPSEPGRNAIERVTIFQVGFTVRPADGSALIARPSRKAAIDDEDKSGALLFRWAREYAAGHTCSADWTIAGGAGEDRITDVHTTWLPETVTPDVSSDGHSFFAGLGTGTAPPLSAAWLAHASAADLGTSLERLCGAYENWIAGQEHDATTLGARERETADRHLRECRHVLDRMRQGVLRLSTDPQAAEAFRLANQAMNLQRGWAGRGALVWRPFQLAFLLLTFESSIDGDHAHRATMDLLWFPTGGGKTEAYLALIAMVAFHRRLRRPKRPDHGAGVAAIMRYTLRLLTTQQFIRAAAMICACDVIRRDAADGRLGTMPISIGLWVGEKATPNLRQKAFESRGDSSLASPRQLTTCPCCRNRLDYEQTTAADPVTIRCRSEGCRLADGQPLPVWTVDEDIYAFRPTLLIGTVDKFAQIVRKQATAALFGIGTAAQPQLILQDELHLIAGPLGTIAGLYETALDLILSRDGTRPKIIGSTATIRGAGSQVLALFDRTTCQFPPPGLTSANSGFAVMVGDEPGHEGESGRRYVGVTTAGRSAKFTLQAVAASLLQTAAAALGESERDNYWTLITYFNSLRELGGALVLMQDDVHDSLKLFADRHGEAARNPETVEELTSRLPQDDVRAMLDRMEIPCSGEGALDVVLATNMLSVGVDIPRLGLMAVNGQPKTIAEYIQATSRVGRNGVRGLVVALLNNAKPRDRSHYETFRTWHETLYRDVEASSVTPFASRARDRALHAVLVAVIRHLVPNMGNRPLLDDTKIAAAEGLIDQIAGRAARVDPMETDVRTELLQRLRRWVARAPDHYWSRRGSSLLQSGEEAAAKRAAGRPVGSAWPTPTSMRGVEPVTPYRLAERLRGR